MIDFTNTSGSLSFADSSSITWSGTLTLLNYHSGSNQLQFGTIP